MTSVSGTVLSLHRHPVKSMGGERVAALRVDHRGAGGDRAHALFDEHRGEPRRFTIRQAPRLVLWHARYDVPGEELDPADPPLPAVVSPDGSTRRWDDPGLPEALAADLGQPVALRRDVAGIQDLADSILVTTRASLEALGSALGRPLDLRRFRPNIHIELDAPAFAEEAMQGARLRVGEVELELLHPCERCVIPTRDPDTAQRDPEILRLLAREHRTLFGINARALAPGLLREGDAVELG